MKSSSENQPAAYEKRDVHVRVVLLTAAFLVVGIAGCFAASAWLYRGTIPATAMIAGPERSFRHGAEEESSIVGDWRTQDAAVRQHLNRYVWVDRQTGIVQIPVERAMELMASSADARKENSP